MARTVLTFDALDLNNGTTYRLLPGASPGQRLKTWDEYRGLNGVPQQTNTTEAYIIPTHWPLVVQGTSLATLDTYVQAINTKIDACTPAAPKSLVFVATTYYIVATPRIDYLIGEREIGTFSTLLDLVLNRLP